MPFFNAHTHIFTLLHVPDNFGKGYARILGRELNLKISWLRKKGIIGWLAKKGPRLFKADTDMLERLINIVKHGEGEKTEGRTQEQIFQNLQSYYPANTKFIVLPMDMDYMGAGKAPEPYPVQLQQLAELKAQPAYQHLLYPFIFADPRRIAEHPEYVAELKEKLSSGQFAGIKMYPALGYWPFDEHLEEVYDFAVENNIPIMSHCVRGVVHDRGPKRFDSHPIKTSARLPGKRSKEYTVHFTHPINFHCLIEPDIISNFWGKPKNYKNLKVCLAHFGGAEEWLKYLQYPWLAPDSHQSSAQTDPALEMENWAFELETTAGEYGWYNVIKAMIQTHPNVYSDVSFMLHDRETWSLLKFMLTISLKQGDILHQRILFGTDFYVVAQKGAERELSIGLRSYLGEELFEWIANKNVKEYLGSDFTDKNSL